MSESDRATDASTTSRRALLQRAGATAGAVSVGGLGAAGVADAASCGTTYVDTYTGGDPHGSPSTRVMNVEVVALGGVGSTNRNRVIQGMLDGLDYCVSNLGSWYGGYELVERTTDCTLGDVSGSNRCEKFETILDAIGENEDGTVYHIIHNKQGSVRCNGPNGWQAGSRPISSISTNNTTYGVETFKIRAFHENLHKFICGAGGGNSVCPDITDLIGSGDNEHWLGTKWYNSSAGQWERTVMADIYWGDAVEEGQCSETDYSATEPTDVKLSGCTKTALERTSDEVS